MPLIHLKDKCVIFILVFLWISVWKWDTIQHMYWITLYKTCLELCRGYNKWQRQHAEWWGWGVLRTGSLSARWWSLSPGWFIPLTQAWKVMAPCSELRRTAFVSYLTDAGYFQLTVERKVRPGTPRYNQKWNVVI